MKISQIQFSELYRRHLCRHSEFGLNVLHLIAVLGVYFSIAGTISAIAMILFPGVPPLTAVAIALIPYTILILVYVPIGTAGLNLAAIGLVAGLEQTCTWLPAWGHILFILFWHRVQLWSHHYYTESFDMSPFGDKYQKGPKLFLVLAGFELPLLIHYFLKLKTLRSELEQLVPEPSAVDS
ncbi:MAG: hypothetical protein JNL58_27715 [Planctomyces sp.]|nr:hypothetical protein [Planctomyces sp.]